MGDSIGFKRQRYFGNPAPRYTIEGELVTTHDIAARIGKSRGRAAELLKLAQAQPGAVTWARLGVQ